MKPTKAVNKASLKEPCDKIARNLKGGDLLTVTFIIGAIIFGLSVIFSLFTFLGSISKRIGASALGIFTPLLFLVCPAFFFGMACMMLFRFSHVWGLAYFFIFMNAGLLFGQYVLLVGSAVFTKNHIYRLTKFFVFKRHSYDDVIGYVMKKEAGLVTTRFGQEKVVDYGVHIYFKGDRQVFFSTKDNKNRKIPYIKGLLEEHHCKRNGRPKKEIWG